MKKILLLSITLSLKCLFINAQAPSWQWALSAGNAANDEVSNAIALDADANVYTTGTFPASLTIGSTTLNTITPWFANVYVSKQDPSGNVLWAKAFASPVNTLGLDGGGGIGYAITTDASKNVYIAGFFMNRIVFGTYTLTAKDTSASTPGDMFVAKLDPSGNVLWANSAGGNMPDLAKAIAVDNSGNVFVTGIYRSKSMSLGSTTLTSPNNGAPGTYFLGTDIFVAKYSSSGTLSWAKTLGSSSTSSGDTGNGITVDPSNNVIISGFFSGLGSTIAFGSTTLSASANNNIFIAKYDNNGNEQWAKSAIANGGNHQANALCSDGNGNIFFTGYTNANTLSIGTVTLNNIGNNTNFFIAKLDPSGTALWAKNAGYNAGGSMGRGVSCDGSGNVFFTGIFNGTICNFVTYTVTNTNSGGNNYDIFLGKYTSTGLLSWVKNVGSIYADESMGISVNTTGEIGITGKITANAAFGTTTLTCGGAGYYSDLFIAKIGVLTGLKEQENNFEFSLYPNPCNTNLNVDINPYSLKTKLTMSIYNSIGQMVYEANIYSGKQTIELPNISAGIYLYHVKNGQSLIKSGKIIIQ
ncbi:MAG: T9SS type A sorting domain-containing protein [Bacteroidetes bacterium]|nr:T9SS type A sorting domain-containing protein [Bacteroidota bacterium]